MIKHSWPSLYSDPSEFPVEREFRVVPLGASMQLHDVDAPNEADMPKSKFYNAGGARDDQFARIPYVERVIASGLPEWSPNPSEFPIRAVVSSIQASDRDNAYDLPAVRNNDLEVWIVTRGFGVWIAAWAANARKGGA